MQRKEQEIQKLREAIWDDEAKVIHQDIQYEDIKITGLRLKIVR